MRSWRSSRAAAVMMATLCASSAAASDQVRIVGSSTVYPFTAVVAEQLGRTGGARPPIVEATGTGGGMKLFCAGVQHPGATNASRRMKKGEFEQCARNGVGEIVEINVGFDGLTIAQSKNATPMKLTLTQLFLAIAKEVPDRDGRLIANPYQDLVRYRPHVFRMCGSRCLDRHPHPARAIPCTSCFCIKVRSGFCPWRT